MHQFVDNQVRIAKCYDVIHPWVLITALLVDASQYLTPFVVLLYTLADMPVKEAEAKSL